MRAALSLSDNQIALLQGPALALPMVIAAVPLGLIIDRYSRVRLLIVFAVLNVIGTILTAFAPTFALLLSSRCLSGLTAFATAPIGVSLLADLYAPIQRGRATMVMALGQVGGMSAAFAIGGVLLAMFRSEPQGWRWAVLGLTGPLVVAACAVLAMREPRRTGLIIEDSSTHKAFAELWRYRAVIVPLLAGVGIVQVAEGSTLIWAAPTLSRAFSLPPDRIGAIMGMALLVSGVLGPIAGGTLADLCQRIGGPRLTGSVLSVLALLSIPTGLFAVAPGIVSTSVPLIMFMTIGAAISVMVTALFTLVIPSGLRGLCMALMLAVCLLLGLGVAPVTVSLLSGAIGGPSMIGRALSVVCVITSAFGAVVFMIGRRHLPSQAVEE